MSGLIYYQIFTLSGLVVKWTQETGATAIIMIK